MNPRTVCCCQPIFSMISTNVAPLLRCSIANTCAVLLPSRGAGAPSPFGDFLVLAALLAGVAFLVALRLAGAPLAACARALAFLSPFGFAVFAAGFAASAKLWMRPQIL